MSQLSAFRSLLLIGMSVVMIAFQMKFLTEGMTIWPPFIIVLIAVYLFRSELRSYDWGNLRKITFWEPTFYALTQGIIAQAIGIVIVQYGLGIEAPIIPFELTPLVALSAIIFSGILEELVHRQGIFGLLDRRIGFWPAALVSSAIFAVAHANMSAWLGYFLLGIVWCRAYKKTGQIGVVIAAHILFNAIAMFVMAGRG